MQLIHDAPGPVGGNNTPVASKIAVYIPFHGVQHYFRTMHNEFSQIHFSGIEKSGKGEGVV